MELFGRKFEGGSLIYLLAGIVYLFVFHDMMPIGLAFLFGAYLMSEKSK
jgi:hypothetical protein